MEVSRTALEAAKINFTFGVVLDLRSIDVIVNAMVGSGSAELKVNATRFLEESLVSEDKKLANRALTVYKMLFSRREEHRGDAEDAMEGAKQKVATEVLRTKIRADTMENRNIKLLNLLRE